MPPGRTALLAILTLAAAPASAGDTPDPMAVCQAFGHATTSHGGDCDALAAAIEGFVAAHGSHLGLIEFAIQQPACKEHFDASRRSLHACHRVPAVRKAMGAYTSASDRAGTSSLDVLPAHERPPHALRRLGSGARSYHQARHSRDSDLAAILPELDSFTGVYPESSERQCTSSHPDSSVWRDLGVSIPGLGGVDLCYQASADRQRFAASARGGGGESALCLRGGTLVEEPAVEDEEHGDLPPEVPRAVAQLEAPSEVAAATACAP